MKTFLILLFAIATSSSFAQINILSTNATADQVMLGDFDPTDYAATDVITDHDEIIAGINEQINSDSLKAYLFEMASFMNRNTGSDTVSATTGIGAARRWAHDKFEEFSAANDNRLIPSYLQFDQVICSMATPKYFRCLTRLEC